MAIIASSIADRLRRSGRYSTTLIRKCFTAFAAFFPALFMVLQALFGEDPSVSVTIFTCSLFFNGAVTAGYLANGLDIAPNFSGTIFGMANTLSSFGGWVSTFMVAVFTHENHTFEQWRYVFWILVAVYAFGAMTFVTLGSGELQPWNSADAPMDAKEMQPLKTTTNGKEVIKEVA